MPEQRCFVFRIDSDVDFVQNELRKGRSPLVSGLL